MRLFELFPDDEAGANDDKQTSFQNKDGMSQRLRQAALDLITPMLGNNVPFVTMKQIIDGLSGARFGIVITPALIMDVLNPDEVKAVSKIDGDRVYLQKPGAPSHEVDQDQQEKDKEQVGTMAATQINKDLQQN
jgi:hypothetical protein